MSPRPMRNGCSPWTPHQHSPLVTTWKKITWSTSGITTEVMSLEPGASASHLPPQATIRIYTISGNLVRILEHADGSGTEEWDVRTRFDLLVASGNYYYHVTTPDGRTHLGRFAVIN